MTKKQIIFKIDPEISSLFLEMEMSDWEYDALKKDIEENGVKVPIIVADDGTIVDGNKRRAIWGELGRFPMDLPHEIRHYNTREEMLEDAITLNVKRRHLNAAQRAYFATRHTLPKEKKAAKERRTRKPKDSVPADLQEQTGETYDIVAKKFGLGGRTLRKAERVFKEAPEKMRRNVLKGKVSIDKAFKDLERKSAQEKSLAESGLTAEEHEKWKKQRKKDLKSSKERNTLLDLYGVGIFDSVFMRMKVSSFATRKKYLLKYVQRLHARAPEELKIRIIEGLEYE